MTSIVAGEVDQLRQQPETRREGLAASGQLSEQHLQPVFAYIYRRVTNRAEAEDITAEVFAVAARMPWKLRGDASDRAWLLAIARHKIADAARRCKRRRETLDVDLTEPQRETVGLLLASNIEELPEEACLHEESRRVVRQMLQRLPADQREALLLQVEHDLPIREIARIMGRSEAATNSLLQRARASLYRMGKSYFAD